MIRRDFLKGSMGAAALAALPPVAIDVLSRCAPVRFEEWCVTFDNVGFRVWPEQAQAFRELFATKYEEQFGLDPGTVDLDTVGLWRGDEPQTVTASFSALKPDGVESV